MHPLPLPGMSATRMRHPSDESIIGYGPRESSFSRASGIVIQVVVVWFGCMSVVEGI
jgi:hypothetical protein